MHRIHNRVKKLLDCFNFYLFENSYRSTDQTKFSTKLCRCYDRKTWQGQSWVIHVVLADSVEVVVRFCRYFLQRKIEKEPPTLSFRLETFLAHVLAECNKQTFILI